MSGPDTPADPSADLVEEVVALPDLPVRVLRPRDAEALLDERAFREEDEFLPYWAELWPAAEALARALAGRRLEGRRVLELGCGVGLPAVVAALRGAEGVLATDWSADALPVVAATAAANDVTVRTACVAWARPEVLLDGAPWSLVVASDVLYERRMVDLLLDLLPRLVGPGDAVLLADPGRPLAADFLAAAQAAFVVRTRPDPVLAHVAVHELRPHPAR